MVVRIHQGQLAWQCNPLQQTDLTTISSTRIEVATSGFVIAPLFPSLQYSGGWLSIPNGA
jgi:hypothetical protein